MYQNFVSESLESSTWSHIVHKSHVYIACMNNSICLSSSSSTRSPDMAPLFTTQLFHSAFMQLLFVSLKWNKKKEEEEKAREKSSTRVESGVSCVKNEFEWYLLTISPFSFFSSRFLSPPLVFFAKELFSPLSMEESEKMENENFMWKFFFYYLFYVGTRGIVGMKHGTGEQHSLLGMINEILSWSSAMLCGVRRVIKFESETWHEICTCKLEQSQSAHSPICCLCELFFDCVFTPF